MASLDFGLTGLHVLITGASGGIGIALVRTFLELGAKVTAHYNTTPRELSAVTDSKLVALQADVTSEDAVQKLFEQAQSKQGGAVQVLVVNHGVFVTQDAALADMPLSQWRSTNSVNLDGSFLLCREFLRRLREQTSTSSEQGNATSVTFIGSTAGKFGEANHADYASSKAAIMYGLVPSLKNEIVRIVPGARVNSVNPGWVATAMAKDVMGDKQLLAKALATTPLQKVATPEDVAKQVAVLASPTLSGHLSGVNLSVDGGMEGRCLYPPPGY
jgi:NAD(P)-dependent dehydrogenase (short-subunit alcohol dehydrogenase family)